VVKRFPTKILKQSSEGPYLFQVLKRSLPEGRRPRGKPRKRYVDGKEEIRKRKGKSLREMRRLAVDRGRWKEFVESPLTL
jgi:hypothetical protein